MYRIKVSAVIILCVIFVGLFFPGCSDINKLFGIEEEDSQVEITKEMLKQQSAC